MHAVLDSLDGMRLLIVHGYADLDPAAVLAWCLGPCRVRVSVIDVAKTVFRTAAHAVPVVLRESSLRPLYVTAAHLAADLVRRMTGRYRLPTPSAALTPLPAATSPDHDTGCGVDLCCGQV